MKDFLRRWFITTLAVAVAAHVVRGISYDTWAGLALAALLLGILNAFLRPWLMVMTLPLMLVTLGLFTLVINAVLLYIVGELIGAFHVRSFGAAFWGGLVISLVSLALNALIPKPERPVPPESTPPPKPPPAGQGPIIDV